MPTSQNTSQATEPSRQRASQKIGAPFRDNCHGFRAQAVQARCPDWTRPRSPHSGPAIKNRLRRVAARTSPHHSPAIKKPHPRGPAIKNSLSLETQYQKLIGHGSLDWYSDNIISGLKQSWRCQAVSTFHPRRAVATGLENQQT